MGSKSKVKLSTLPSTRARHAVGEAGPPLGRASAPDPIQLFSSAQAPYIRLATGDTGDRQSCRATGEPATKSRRGALVMARGLCTFGRQALLGAPAVGLLGADPRWSSGFPQASPPRGSQRTPQGCRSPHLACKHLPWDEGWRRGCWPKETLRAFPADPNTAVSQPRFT